MVLALLRVGANHHLVSLLDMVKRPISDEAVGRHGDQLLHAGVLASVVSGDGLVDDLGEELLIAAPTPVILHRVVLVDDGFLALFTAASTF